MQIERKHGVRVLVVGAAAGALAVLAWAATGGHSLWSELLAWLMTTQAALHRQLATAIRLVAQEGWAAGWPLVGISLLYGVFHAAGPGHGKAVIATYLGTSRTRLRQGVVLSVSSALVQGLMAVALVEVLVGLLGYSLRRTQGAGTQLENLSFALVALLGAVLALKCAMALYRRWRPPTRSTSLFSGAGKMRPYCVDCGGLHRFAGDHLDGPLTWRTGLPIVLAIGIRPCTGAVLVLLVAYSLGLRWAGVAAVLAMSLGTAATVSLLAAMAVSFRQGALRLLQRETASMHCGRLVFDILGLVGGTAICLMGFGLLQQSLNTAAHPLL